MHLVTSVEPKFCVFVYLKGSFDVSNYAMPPVSFDYHGAIKIDQNFEQHHNTNHDKKNVWMHMHKKHVTGQKQLSSLKLDRYECVIFWQIDKYNLTKFKNN